MFKNFSSISLQENKLTTWKYHRTQLWMEYCNREVILPSPFNLVNYAFDLVIIMGTFFWQTESLEFNINSRSLAGAASQPANATKRGGERGWPMRSQGTCAIFLKKILIFYYVGTHFLPGPNLGPRGDSPARPAAGARAGGGGSSIANC